MFPFSSSPTTGAEKSTPVWHRLSDMGLTAASVATAIGFEAATRGTHLGFQVTRGITSAVAYNSTALAERVVFGGSVGAAPAIGKAINSAFTFAESLALAPIQLGHNLASTSLVAASSSLYLLVWLFGTQEVGFSLIEFGGLVQREWANPPGAETLPPGRFGAASVARALVAWAALQDATSVWGMTQCLTGAKEIPMSVWKAPPNELGWAQGEANEDDPEELEIVITSDEQLPDHGGTLLQAQISFRPPGAYIWAESEEEEEEEEIPVPEPRNKAVQRSDTTSTAATRRDTKDASTPVVDWAHLRPVLRRMSHMVIGGYGGASFLFFGLAFPSIGSAAASSPPIKGSASSSSPQADQSVADVVHMAESSAHAPASQNPPEPRRTWWGLVTGRHDREIFERFAGHPDGEPPEETTRRNTAMLGEASRLPRFWVLTDHARKQVVLVLRGTYSLNEVAIDLTCDPMCFVPATENAYGSKRGSKADEKSGEEEELHFVHGGMFMTAELMGLPGRPVHTAVANALRANRGYELVLTGHSLGAGVASILALIWGDPATGLTVQRSGLPSHRRITAYCFGPPCVMSAGLSKQAKSIVTSFVYSHDIVSTLSLGSVRDMQRAAAWLCAGGGDESCSNVLSKAARGRFGRGGEETDAEVTAQWLLSIRKTLEANMNMADLFPAGRVLWALNDCDVLQETLERVNPGDREPGVLRLFEVDDVERAFSQIVFSRDMLSSHLPHNYNRVIQELL